MKQVSTSKYASECDSEKHQSKWVISSYLPRCCRKSPCPRKLVINRRLNLREFSSKGRDALCIDSSFCFGVHMIELSELAVAGILSMGHWAEDISGEVRNSGCSIGNILSLLKLNMVAIFHERLAGLLLFEAFWILENCPEVGNAKDDFGPYEGLL